MARLILNSPNYASYRYAFAGALLTCKDFPHFFPPALLDSLLSNLERQFQLKEKWTEIRANQLLQNIYQENELSLLRSWVYKESPYDVNMIYLGDTRRTWNEYLNHILDLSGNHSEYRLLMLDTVETQGILRGDPVSTGLRLITESRGLDISHWFMDLTQPTYRYHNGGYIRPKTLKEILRLDSSFEQTTSEKISSFINRYYLKKDFAYSSQANSEDHEKQEAEHLCDQLKDLSQNSLADTIETP